MTHSQETPDQSQKAEPLPETREPLKAYQRLSEKIQDAIEKGGLKVGDKLPPERALAETFGYEELGGYGAVAPGRHYP